MIILNMYAQVNFVIEWSMEIYLFLFFVYYTCRALPVLRIKECWEILGMQTYICDEKYLSRGILKLRNQQKQRCSYVV